MHHRQVERVARLSARAEHRLELQARQPERAHRHERRQRQMRAETVRRGSSQGVSSRSCDNCVVTDCQVLRCSLPFYEARAFLQKPTRIDVGLCQDHIGQFDRGDECVYDYDQNVVLFGGDVAAPSDL